MPVMADAPSVAPRPNIRHAAGMPTSASSRPKRYMISSVKNSMDAVAGFGENDTSTFEFAVLESTLSAKSLQFSQN
jgi:hypothetical protein